MLMHGVPWQWAIGVGFIYTIVSGLLLIISSLLGLYGCLPFIAIFLLLISLALIVMLIPLFMNLSRSYFSFLYGYLLIHVLMTVLTCALYYRDAGIIDMDGKMIRGFWDCFYFSLNTWSTLGVSDFRVHPALRLFSSCEALIGLISFALAIALLWLWCTENMLPKEQALFDGNRRHRKSLTVHRMRIRTITGKDKELGNEWVDPPKPGESYRWDDLKEEWIVITNPAEVNKDDLIIEKERKPNHKNE